MAAFLKMGDIEGESTDEDHDNWINLDNISESHSRSIVEGAKDVARSRGTTTMNDVALSRPLDKSSVKLAEACAKGIFFDEVEIHLTTEFKGKEKPYLKYKLHDVIITSYNFHGTAAANPPPSETVTLNYTKVEWTYVTYDHETGDEKGNVPGDYSLGK
jgi:type VI secretion system secreted protein Hcp